MKAILLAPTPPPAGGIAGWTERMLHAELKDGWKLAVVDEKAIGKRQVFGKDGRRNFFDEAKRCRNIWRGLRKELKDPEAKVVHSCIPSVPLAMIREYICAVITKNRGRKFVINFRCTVPVTAKGRISRFVLKMLCGGSDLILTVNQQSSDYLSRITKTPIRLIPNFISAEELSSDHEVREELRTVVYVGGIVEKKGINDCLEIAKKLPDISFRFVGKGNDAFERRAESEKIHNAVFTGQKDRKEVKKELEKADVFLFMTYFPGEGFSNALCEAMAAGLPCVVTDWAANKDMIGKDGGIVVRVKDVDGAVEAIKAMLKKEVREAMSSANLRKTRAEYIDSVVIDRYIDAYESIL